MLREGEEERGREIDIGGGSERLVDYIVGANESEALRVRVR